jgi:hypothetical protein
MINQWKCHPVSLKAVLQISLVQERVMRTKMLTGKMKVPARGKAKKRNKRKNGSKCS